MLARVSKTRHVMVGAVVAGVTVLVGTGLIGDSHPERFDTWQSVITPAGGDAIRIVDTFDQDFGSNDRRGHERFIENDFGVPIDVSASSDSAPDDLNVTDFGVDTRVRVGDPNVTISGQHRYTVGYTLPDALVSTGVLALDVLSASDDGSRALEIETFEVVVTGFVLEDPICTFGPQGSEEECEFAESRDGYYRAVIEPLDEGAGVTVGGTIVDIVEPETVPPPPLPERRSSSRGLLALATAGLGALGAFGVFRWARRRGRNEVFAGGAADAAFGALPPPGSAKSAPPTAFVTDRELDEMATIEFVPPDGVDPWEGSALLRERVDDDTVEAWLSGLAGAGGVALSDVDDKLSIGSGPEIDRLDPVDRSLLQAILEIDDPYVTGKYDKKFASAWSAIERSLRERVNRESWWKHPPSGSGFSTNAQQLRMLLIFGGFAVVFWGSAATALLGALGSWPAALAFGLILPAIAAYAAYRVLLPQRSAAGSALALRTESFRRFLHASEASHVEWAWEQGLLREYSGWAVAVGEADAWSKALDRANVPPPARGVGAAPIIVARRAPSIQQSRVRPQQSGGRSGGGGFSGGSVGGGGGGSSRGSW